MIVRSVSYFGLYSRLHLHNLISDSDIDILQIKLVLPHYPRTVCILEKFCTSATVASCVIPDESIPNQLEVQVRISYILQCHDNMNHRIRL